MVNPIGEPTEPKKLVSVTEILDRHQAETPSTTQPTVTPHFETVTGDSVLDKLSNLATWNDIVEPPPLNRKEVKPQDSDTTSVPTARRHIPDIRQSAESCTRSNRRLVNRHRPTSRARAETQQSKGLRPFALWRRPLGSVQSTSTG
jgi:hypothetical protein